MKNKDNNLKLNLSNLVKNSNSHNTSQNDGAATSTSNKPKKFAFTTKNKQIF